MPRIDRTETFRSCSGRGSRSSGCRIPIEVWTARHGVAIADWPDKPVDPFFNVNTPEDAAEAARLAAQYRDL